MFPMRQLNYDLIIRDRNFKWVIVSSGLDMKHHATVQIEREQYNSRHEKLLQKFLRIFSRRLLYLSRSCTVAWCFICLIPQGEIIENLHWNRRFRRFMKSCFWIPVVKREFALQQKIYIYRFTHMSNTLWSIVFESL